MILRALRFWGLMLLSSLCLSPLLAQPLFEQITSEDGLSENVVNGIFQDSKGFVWFATNDGLNKYDGYEFTIYKPGFYEEGKINSNLIFAITEDLDGNIWIGTTGSGINRFDPKTEQFTSFENEIDDPNSLNSNYVASLNRDSKGRIWVGTNRGLNVFDPTATETKFQNYKIGTNRHNTVFDVLEDPKGIIWVASLRGLFKSNGSDDLEGFKFEEVKLEDVPEVRVVRALALDKYDRLIVGHLNGVYCQKVSGHKASFMEVGDLKEVHAIVIDDQNTIWAGSSYGLHCLRQEEGTLFPEFVATYTQEALNPRSLNKSWIVSLFKDWTGVIWVGTNGGGVNKFDPNRKAFKHYGKFAKTEEGYQKIRSVLEDSNGDLWVGTEEGGLFWQDAKGAANGYESLQHIAGLRQPFALAEVEIGDKKKLLIGSQSYPALYQLDISSATPGKLETLESDFYSLFAILQDQEQNIWLGTYNEGLERWTPRADGSGFDKTSFKHDVKNPTSLSNNIVRKLIQDSRGNLWIGTGNGLNKLSADQLSLDEVDFEVIKNVPGDAKSLSHNYILDMIESRYGDLWIGTFGGGLNKYISASTSASAFFESYSEKDGLPNGSIKSILEDDDGHLWISSNKGLTKFDPIKKTFSNFNTLDGLQSNEFLEMAACRRKNGEMVFGGVNGFNVFQPEAIVEDTFDAEVVFTHLKILNKEIEVAREYEGQLVLEQSLPYTKEIKLDYDENNFSIEFAGLDYASSRQLFYAHMLEGFHDDWQFSTSKNRLATYTNLPPGDYVLKVKTSDTENHWGGQISSLAITINPPIWLTWYAYLFYALLAIGLLWLFREYELIGIKEKHQLMLEHLEKEKREEVHDLKLRFFTNISHELRTPLTLIIAPLENLIKGGKSLTKEKLNQQYHLMYKNSKYLLRLVDQLLDFRKLDQGQLNLEVHQGEIVRFVKDATEPFQFLANKQQIDFTLESEEEKIYLWFDQDVVEKILYNLISNAFKFTPNGGKVQVFLREVNELRTTAFKKNKLQHYLELKVEDTGIGLSPKVAKRIFERFYKEGQGKFTKDGAGIGLSFTQSLVKRHYGEILVNSKKGEGTSFIVKLPMAKSVFAKAEIVHDSMKAHSFSTDPLEYFSPDKPTTLPQLESSKYEQDSVGELPLLLFVDDNADIRKFIQSGFENDFRIIDTDNGLKGLELAKTSLPDIIICDVMMPEMNGIEMCKLLKQDIATSHIPIVLLTAKTTTQSEMDGLEIGADAYVRKPFQLDILKQQILNIYAQREKLKTLFRQEIILQPADVTVTTADEQFLQRVMDLIEEHMSDADFNVEALVKKMYISRSKLYLKIKALTGQPTSEFVRTIRLKRAVQLLSKSDLTIKEIMFMTGFNTASYFSKCFKKQYGMVPSEYVRNQRDYASQEKPES